MPRLISIGVIADPACPWCLLGLHRLDRALARLPGDVAVSLAYVPFLLDTETPEGGEDVAELLTRKYGRPPGEMWDRLEDEADKSGLGLDMRKQTRRYPSQPALALVLAAGERGTSYALGRALGRANYLEALDISNPEILAGIAAEHGFAYDEAVAIASDPEKQRAAEEMALNYARQGVNGVPFFVFDGKFRLNGAQPEAVFDQALRAVLEADETPGGD